MAQALGQVAVGFAPAVLDSSPASWGYFKGWPLTEDPAAGELATPGDLSPNRLQTWSAKPRYPFAFYQH